MSGNQMEPIVLKLNVLSVPVSRECAEMWELLYRPLPFRDELLNAMSRRMMSNFTRGQSNDKDEK